MGDRGRDYIPLQAQVKGNSCYEINGKIMVAAIVSLSVVVVLVALLHLYARYVTWWQARHQAVARELGLTNIMQWQDLVEPPKTGVDPLVLAALPVHAYTQQGGEHDIGLSTVEAECTVCLSLLEEGDLARILPNCKHVFHVECIDRWLGSQTTCPVCRNEAEPQSQPAPAEAASDAEPTPLPLEENSEGGDHPLSRVSGSSSRFSSFRRMPSRERASKRMPSCRRPNDATEDLERT